MKTIILKVIFIVLIIFFGISNSQITNSYFSVGGEYTISEYQRSVIKANITKKILERNARIKKANSNYVDYSPVNDYTLSNDYSLANNYNTVNDYNSVNPIYDITNYDTSSIQTVNQNYVLVKPVPYTTKFSFQKDKGFYNSGRGNTCINIRNTYRLQRTYLTPELNRLIINKKLGYSLYRDRVQYYNYFLTYSNNYYVRGKDNSRSIVKSYIDDLIDRNFDNLYKINIRIEDEISEIKDRLDSCYNSYGNLSNVDLLKKNLKTLYKIQDRIEDDKDVLNQLLKYNNIEER